MLVLRPDPSSYRLGLQAVAEGWDESGQPGLGEFMAEMPRGAGRQRMLGTVTRRMMINSCASPKRSENRPALGCGYAALESSVAT